VRDCERVEAPVADDLSGADAGAAIRRTPRTISRRERKAENDDGGTNECRDVRRAPIQCRRSQRNDGDRDAPAADGRGAVEPLCSGRSDRRSDVVAAGDESDAGSKSGDQPADDCDSERRDQEREQVPGSDNGERPRRQVPRSALIDEPPSRNLHRKVRREQRGRQEADRAQADVVGVRDDVRDGPDVGSVETDRRADRDARGGSS
jgi:hypothetical protein